MVPILFDTDIGSDIDDAVALGYLLRQPECELVGITTVSGEAQRRAALADAVCRAAGRTDIPIHAGIEQPLVGPLKQPACPQAEVLDKFDHTPPQDYPLGDAIDFMRRTIRGRPGEITLLAVGPMTNLGTLFAVDREIPSLLKGIVLMCGQFMGAKGRWTRAEWNALNDPEATHIVYSARPAAHLSIGLDVTAQCRLDVDKSVSRFERAGGPLEVVAAAMAVWGSGSKKSTYHDPLAAAVIFQPDLVTTVKGLVRVDIRSDLATGMTVFSPNGDEKPHDIAKTVKPDAFFKHYFEVVGAPIS